MRIASLQPSITLTIERLGKLDHLAACTKYCVEALPHLAGLGVPVIADSWSTSAEEILAVRPDLVLASVPYRMESLAAILKAGCPVLALAPHSLADIYSDIRLIASVLNVPERGAALVREMRSGIEAVQATLRDSLRPAVIAGQAVPHPLVYCEEWGKPLIHSQTWVAELVSAAGGRFLATPGATTTAESIAAADPDVLLFAWCGAGDRVPLARVIEQRGWQSLSAVRKGAVHCIPDEYLNTPAHTLVEGLQMIAATLHPGLFPSHAKVKSLNATTFTPEPSIL